MSEVSVAMATCNGAAWVAAQLESLAAQTRRPAELVVCDDASDDATLDRVREFAAEAPRRHRELRARGRPVSR